MNLRRIYPTANSALQNANRKTRQGVLRPLAHNQCPPRYETEITDLLCLYLHQAPSDCKSKLACRLVCRLACGYPKSPKPLALKTSITYDNATIPSTQALSESKSRKTNEAQSTQNIRMQLRDHSVHKSTSCDTTSCNLTKYSPADKGQRIHKAHVNRIEGTWAHVNRIGRSWAHENKFGRTWAHVNRIGCTWAHVNRIGCTWAHVNRIGRNWAHDNKFGCTWAHVNRIGCTWPHVSRIGHTWAHENKFGRTFDALWRTLARFGALWRTLAHFGALWNMCSRNTSISKLALNF